MTITGFVLVDCTEFLSTDIHRTLYSYAVPLAPQGPPPHVHHEVVDGEGEAAKVASTPSR